MQPNRSINGFKIWFFSIFVLLILASCSATVPLTKEERFLDAIADGRIQEVRSLIIEGVSVYAKDHYGESALHKASKTGNIEIAKMLLEIGVYIDAQNDIGNTPLMLAAENGNIDVVRALISAGADVNMLNNFGGSALILTSQTGAPEVIEELLENGADADVKGLYGRNPLMISALYGSVPSIRIFVKHVTDINDKDSYGQTALILALSSRIKNIHEIIKLLIEAGVDVNAVNDNGVNALMMAVKIYPADGLVPIIAFLKEAGAEMNAKDNNGNTALMRIYSDVWDLLLPSHFEGNYEKIKLLVKAGADVNATNKSGDTLLLRLANSRVKCDGIIRLLIEAGADAKVTDKNGKTPLVLAESVGIKDNIRVIRDAVLKNQKGSSVQIAKAEKKEKTAVYIPKTTEAPEKAASADSEPPIISVLSPVVSRGIKIRVNQHILDIKGNASDKSGIAYVKVNDTDASLSVEGDFVAPTILVVGSNNINISAMDGRGNIGSYSFVIERPPVRTSPSSMVDPARSFGGQRWAVVIGLSDYGDKSGRIPGLRYADRDAQAFYRFIRSPLGGAFPIQNTRLLVNQDATTQKIKDALFGFLRKAIKEDLVIIYFAGHGAPEPENQENLYLLTYDTDPDRLFSTAFPMWDLETALKRYIKSEKVIVLADACHSAGLFSDIGTRATADENLINKYLTNLQNAGKGRAVFTASEASERSQESQKWGGGHGVFTYFLLEGLKGQADYNSDGVVTLGEAMDYTDERVRRETMNNQHPSRAGRFDRNIPMAVLR